MKNVEKYIKTLNINELLFDFFVALLLIILQKLFPVIANTNISGDFYDTILLLVLFLFPLIILINVGKMAGNYRQHKSGFLLGALSILTIFLVAFAIMSVLDDYYDYFLDNIAPVVLLVAFLPAVLLGFLSKTKSFLKAVTVSGIIFLLSGIVIIGIYMLAERLYKDSFSLIALGSSVIAGFFVFIYLPRKLVRQSEKSRNVQKFLTNTFAVLSAISFSVWYYVSDNQLISTDEFGIIYESSLIELYWGAIFLFRLMMALEPPKNKMNMIIGLVVLVISYLI
jgi:hypothetical protein